MTNITQMLNITAQNEHEHDYSEVINTKVSSEEQLIEAVESALIMADMYAEDGDFTQVDVSACVELLRDFSSADLTFEGSVCFWFDRPVKI